MDFPNFNEMAAAQAVGELANQHSQTTTPIPDDDKLISTIESVTLTWRDGGVVQMARKNGHVRLHKVEDMTYTDFNDLMGAHTPKV